MVFEAGMRASAVNGLLYAKREIHLCVEYDNEKRACISIGSFCHYALQVM